MYILKLGVAFVQYTQWPHCFCINTVSVFAISLASKTQPTPTQMAFRVPCVILKAIHAGVGWVWLARLCLSCTLYSTGEHYCRIFFLYTLHHAKSIEFNMVIYIRNLVNHLCHAGYCILNLPSWVAPVLHRNIVTVLQYE